MEKQLADFVAIVEGRIHSQGLTAEAPPTNLIKSESNSLAQGTQVAHATAAVTGAVASLVTAGVAVAQMIWS